MPELADIFFRYGPEYKKRFQGRILPSHLRAMQDIVDCRTEVLGGHAYLCENDTCREQYVYSYHSCKNRHCPKCQNDQAEQWLRKQRLKLLPVPYFLVGFTLPAELRNIARAHQKAVYNAFFQSSADALQKLALDPRFVGGLIGMTGVLHTWDRTGGYHPHVHYLVPGGGLSLDHSTWLPSRPDFLVRIEPLSIIFKAKFRQALKKTGLFDQAPAGVWEKEWVTHSKAVGSGKEAAMYLARYIYRVAFTNASLLKMENDTVTFKYKESKTKVVRTMTLPVMTFMHRFLQHVLPKNFIKVRHYGFHNHKNKHLLAVVRYLLAVPWLPEEKKQPIPAKKLYCPGCQGELRLVANIKARGPPRYDERKKAIFCHGAFN